ncbi:phosphonate metabolism transcriptional regulator PhnF [Halodesulfovibrio marinisediminis]|uniref:GntR family transcriptional regulator, phosphonate transport system regulatory protein n=1 Tax=Halodesulfovibrio marinisediminis DSM 17456 TaxID=1121457 RepID=A0A1N6DWM2_9BACT|nr:phosphonate metabolism transcriptional regulator PhnF [Halodesulfovibrio marinisediminis]SIN75198.1 GntR family transcriptional regulator, phosphonate transport system regulatory protein [Halodesulfovibrio marinisediminis DSM 17456]
MKQKENKNSPQKLVRAQGVTLWHQIQSVLEKEIYKGAYSAGEKLPTEKQLSERFNVNRHTVRQALAGLVRKELIVVEQGRGAFVRRDKLDYFLARRVRFRENLLRQRKVPSEELLKHDVVSADAVCAKALCLRPMAPLVRLRSVGSADAYPLCCTTQYFPQERFPAFGDIYVDTCSVTAVFTALGVTDYVRKSTRIMARMANAEETRLLKLGRQSPVMVVESVNVDSEETPVEYSVCVWAADRIQFVVDSD